MCVTSRSAVDHTERCLGLRLTAGRAPNGLTSRRLKRSLERLKLTRSSVTRRPSDPLPRLDLRPHLRPVAADARVGVPRRGGAGRGVAQSLHRPSDVQHRQHGGGSRGLRDRRARPARLGRGARLPAAGARARRAAGGGACKGGRGACGGSLARHRAAGARGDGGRSAGGGGRRLPALPLADVQSRCADSARTGDE